MTEQSTRVRINPGETLPGDTHMNGYYIIAFTAKNTGNKYPLIGQMDK